MGSQQIIHVPGVANFRDIGGFSAQFGYHVRRGLIYRSGCLEGLTEDGKTILESLGIKDVFDLRRVEEISEHAVQNSVYETWLYSPDGPTRHIFPIFRDDNGSPSDLARMLRLKEYASNSTEVSSSGKLRQQTLIMQGFVKIYRSMLLNSGEVLAKILGHFCMDYPSPILVNCTAGKDRTGVVVMALLLLAGCSAQDVAKDYHLSEEGLGVDWMTEAIERMHQKPPFVGEERKMVGAREEVMIDVVTMVEQDWGGIESFLYQIAHLERTVIETSQMALKEKTEIEDGY